MVATFLMPPHRQTSDNSFVMSLLCMCQNVSVRLLMSTGFRSLDEVWYRYEECQNGNIGGS